MNWAEWLPRLSRFYGPHDWVAMPWQLLYGYLQMYSRLMAEEALAGVNVTAVGSGRLKEEDARRTIQRLEGLARGNTPAARDHVSRREQVARINQSFGIVRA